MGEQYFLNDERLGIPLPNLTLEWDDYSSQEKQLILTEWECIRGEIPDRIYELEQKINKKQEKLNNEHDFVISCKLNSEIAELASIINDLWLWFRSNQELSEDNKLHR